MLAVDILKRIAGCLNLPSFLEITVEDSEQMDLADFDRGQHAGVILDGVGDAYFLKRNREVLQGAPKLSRVPDRPPMFTATSTPFVPGQWLQHLTWGHPT